MFQPSILGTFPFQETPIDSSVAPVATRHLGPCGAGRLGCEGGIGHLGGDFGGESFGHLMCFLFL